MYTLHSFLIIALYMYIEKTGQLAVPARCFNAPEYRYWVWLEPLGFHSVTFLYATRTRLFKVVRARCHKSKKPPRADLYLQPGPHEGQYTDSVHMKYYDSYVIRNCI